MFYKSKLHPKMLTEPRVNAVDHTENGKLHEMFVHYVLNVSNVRYFANTFQLLEIQYLSAHCWTCYWVSPLWYEILVFELSFIMSCVRCTM